MVLKKQFTVGKGLESAPTVNKNRLNRELDIRHLKKGKATGYFNFTLLLFLQVRFIHK